MWSPAAAKAAVSLQSMCLRGTRVDPGFQTIYAELQSAKMVHNACAPLQRSVFYVFNSAKSVCLDGTHKCKIAHFGADGRVKREHWCLASGNARQCVDRRTLDHRLDASQIIPSQMEVAPLHCTVDITQKRRLFKNTKETEKM